MSDDLDLANLLGEAPSAAPDPGFRYDVFARVAERARRRAALSRGLNRIATFTAIGLGLAIAQAAGLTFDAAQPILVASGALLCAAAVATLTIGGPKAVLARSRAMLRHPLLRA